MAPQVYAGGANGDGTITITGERQQWHNITLSMAGPFGSEQGTPNPFTDFRMEVDWRHEDGTHLRIPGYFAADGNAAESSATSGNVWRAHFAPDRTGTWRYTVRFRCGPNVAIATPGPNDQLGGEAFAPYDGGSGQIQVRPSDKDGRDLRGEGRLCYVGKRYLQFAGSKRFFLKVGADAPETLLAYQDFDGTVTNRPKRGPLKTWQPHIGDWRAGDPTWQQQRGKGLIGAINYLSGKGCNAFSFLTYNAGGDGDNVWPFIARDAKLRYDCSKLDQWGIVFAHATRRGMYLHFKLQETENDDNRIGTKTAKHGAVPTSLDGGELGPERRLYCRELVARFAHNLALNWNIGEENTQSTRQQLDMMQHLARLDAYDHPIVLHTYPNQQKKVYEPLLGNKSPLTGLSLQNSSLHTTHTQTVHWVQRSEATGKPWVVAFDESGSAAHGQCPDLGYRGFDGHDRDGRNVYTQHKVRKFTLWGHLMAGGAGNEYYFGYKFAENDLLCEDWRSRNQSWDYCRIAIQFFREHNIPFWEMTNLDQLVSNPQHQPTRFCFGKRSQVYLVYLPNGGTTSIDLTDDASRYHVHWFNPREGGELVPGTVRRVTGGRPVPLGKAPADESNDWLVVLRCEP